jgi:hypothetical protein
MSNRVRKTEPGFSILEMLVWNIDFLKIVFSY